jgi:ubiquinone/menaquinone biosynthesis C-methylase UbiE
MNVQGQESCNPALDRAEYYNDLAQTVFFPVYPVIANEILKKADIDTGQCLDVGSGPGYLSIALATLSNLTVYALDNSRPMRNIAIRNAKKYRLEHRVKPVSGDINEFPFDARSMDLVVSRGTFFFWNDLSRGFFECLRVLKPGGMAYIGDGFGNVRLRDEIVSQMRERSPLWEGEGRGWYAQCDPHMIRSALAAAGIFEYDFIHDESGYWVCFTRNE